MAANEGIAIDGLAVNDEVNFALEELTFVPAKKQPQFIDNPDADGSALAYEPNYTNGEFQLKIRIVPQVTMDTALAKWGELQAKLQKASLMRDQGGISIVWTPAGATRTYTGWALLGEISELPITVSGDLAGWFVNSPVVTVKLTCKPFLYLPERTLKAGTASEVPLQELELKEVGGDVPAEGRLIVTEKSAVDRRHLEWGVDRFSGGGLIPAASLSVAGFTGTLAASAEAYGGNAISGTAVAGAWSTLCGTGNISNIGSYRAKLRVWCESTEARFRISYRVADGPFRTLQGQYASVAVPVAGQWCEIDVGEVTLEEVTAGTQRSEIRIEAMSTGTAHPVVLNYMMEIPTTDGYGKARGLQLSSSMSLLAFDEFAKATAGNLDTPKALELGGNWSEVNKTAAAGFVLNAVSDLIERTSVSDANVNSGCFALAGAASYESFNAQVDVLDQTALLAAGLSHIGVLGRYASVEKWIKAVIETGNNNDLYLRVWKSVPGSVVSLGSVLVGKLKGTGGKINGDQTVALNVSQDGTWRATCAGKELSGQHADLAPGGALASGKVGLYDSWAAATAGTRRLKRFSVFAAENAGRVCFASRKAEVRSDSSERQDATGTYYGPPSSYRGARFFAPPGKSRLALKMRRNDVDREIDAFVTDKQEVEVKIAERFLAPR